MTLTWAPPRSIKHLDETYKQTRHWLVNEEGRIMACVIDPAQDNPEDSFDARLHYTNTDDTGYFISLGDAQAWCEKRCRDDAAAKQAAAVPATMAVVTETA